MRLTLITVLALVIGCDGQLDRGHSQDPSDPTTAVPVHPGDLPLPPAANEKAPESEPVRAPPAPFEERPELPKADAPEKDPTQGEQPGDGTTEHVDRMPQGSSNLPGECQGGFCGAPAAGSGGGCGCGGGSILVNNTDTGQSWQYADDEPTGDTSNAVEEADIYAVSGSDFFYFNSHRGLLIYDISKPDAPSLRSRVAIYGTPVEMFVSGDTVVALVSGVMELKKTQGRFSFHVSRSSQLVVIDAKDRNAPKVLVRLPMEGTLREGATRKIGNRLFVAAHLAAGSYAEPKEERAWIYAFDIENPAQTKQTGKLLVFETKTGTRVFDGGQTTDVFKGLTFSATPDALLVVENWQRSGHYQQEGFKCIDSVVRQLARVSIVSTQGQGPTLRARFETNGALRDQFKHALYHDPTSNKTIYLGIFQRSEWSSSDCKGTRLLQNTLESWDVSTAEPKKLGSLRFGKANETVRGSAFDVGRRVAYAITAQQIDPLYAIDFSNPTKLAVLSEIDGLSGDMNVFRLVGDGKFLLAVGRDNTTTCEGFNDGSRRAANVAVSVIDVQHTEKIRLVQRRCVTVENAQHFSSSVNLNLDQAHKMIGLASDDRANVITVPVTYWQRQNQNGWSVSSYNSAVGMLSWDLSAYDPTRDHTAQSVLKNRSSVVHAGRTLRRSIVLTHPVNGRRTLVGLSDTHISLTDIDALDAPKALAEVEVAPFHAGVFTFGDHLVDHLKPTTADAVSTFRVKKTKTQDVVAEFKVAAVGRAIKVGDHLVLLRRKLVDRVYQVSALAYRLADPTNPVAGQPLTLDGTDKMVGYSLYSAIPTGNALAMLVNTYDKDTKERTWELVVLRIDGAALTLERQKLPALEGRRYLSVYADQTDPDAFLLSYSDELAAGDTTQLARRKHFLQRWTAGSGSLKQAHSINIPGRLLSTVVGSNGNKLFVTLSYEYQGEEKQTSKGETYTRWTSTPRLNLLRRIKTDTGYAAALRSSELLSERSWPVVAANGRTLMLSSYRVSKPGQASTPELQIFDITALTLARAYRGDTGLSRHGSIELHHERAFFNLYGLGVLVADISDISNPTVSSFVPVASASQVVTMSPSHALVVAGHRGLFRVALY